MNIYETAMELGIEEAKRTMMQGIGGPFGAVIIDPRGEVITVASNHVLSRRDPTAHAEVEAIRETCKKIGSHDLTGYTLLATGYPCPMCLGAIMWANIKRVYVSGLPEDAKEIGFRDDFMYDVIRNGCTDKNVIDIINLDRKPAKELYKMYKESNKQMY